jgi:hypothetical protein
MGSFSFDLSGLVTVAGELFRGLVPIVAIVGGLVLGGQLFRFVLNQIKSVF